MLPSCSETDLTMKFLLCGALLALSVWSHAEGAKVLGFTMDAPAPDGAALLDDGGGYAQHGMAHKLCAGMVATSDDLGVFVVTCQPAPDVDWNALLSAKYGSSVAEHSGARFWAANGFAFVCTMANGIVAWWAPRIAPILGEHSSLDDVRTALTDAVEKIKDAHAFIAAAKHADVIAEEDF